MFSRWRHGAPHKTDLGFGPEAFLGLAEGSPDLLAIATDDQIVFANAAARRFLTGSSETQVAGRSLLSVIHPEDREEGRARLDQVRTTGRGVDWTNIRLSADDGSTLEMWVRVVAIDFRGRESLLVIGRDETAARLARRERKDSELRYETLANTVPILIVRLDADGRCVYVNKGWSTLAIMDPKDVVGKRWTELIEPPYRPAAEKLWRRIQRKGREQRGEFSFTRRDGRAFDVLAHAVPERDASGEITGWVATLTDTTDLKRAQRALAESEERLRLALEAANVASWETDNAPSDAVRWSANAGRVLGLPDEAVPRSRSGFWALMPPERADELRRQARAAIAANEVLELEFRLPDGPGGERWLALRGRGLASGRLSTVRMAGIVSDVTARRRLADERAALLAKLQEAQRLESLGLLAGGIAHDFNNLLVGILGNAELALAAAPPGTALRERIEDLRAASLRAAELAQQILVYSGRGPLQVAPVDLGALAQEAISLLRASLGASVNVRLQAQPGAIAQGDATQLHQVLMNLVRNAADSLGPSGGDVAVEVGTEPGGEQVRLTVLDTGCGMDGTTRARIFDPFFTTRATGRGLGLAVVHGIVRAHGGEIAVESELGRGTRMDVRLPASRAPIEPAEPRRREPEPASEGQLVLVIDDERAVRDVARLALEAAGYRVLSAGDAAEARERASHDRHRLRAIVLDLTLGRSSSEPVLAALRELAPDVPILLTSGYPDEEALARLAGYGIAGFLPKPFTPAQLAARVAEAIARAPARNA